MDTGTDPAAKLLAAEGAVAVPEQHRDVVGAEVGAGEIELAVAVEVADRNATREMFRQRNSFAAPKVPSPFPSSTETLLESGVLGHEVELAIAVQVRDRN